PDAEKPHPVARRRPGDGRDDALRPRPGTHHLPAQDRGSDAYPRTTPPVPTPLGEQTWRPWPKCCPSSTTRNWLRCAPTPSVSNSLRPKPSSAPPPPICCR